MILTAKIFSKYLKLRSRYFFGTPYNILRGKKIGEVKARSIWAEMSLYSPCQANRVVINIRKLRRTGSG